MKRGDCRHYIKPAAPQFQKTKAVTSYCFGMVKMLQHFLFDHNQPLC